MRIFTLLIFLIIFLPKGGNAAEQLTPGKLKLADVLKEALEKNPGIKKAKHRALSAEAKIWPAGSYPDPMLGFAVSNYPIDTLSGSQTPMSGKELSITQAIPFPGKKTQKRKAAEAHFESINSQYEHVQLQTLLNAKRSYYSLYLSHRKLEIAKDNLETLRNFVETAKSKYSVGKGLQQDVLKAQLSHSQVKRNIIVLRKNLRAREAALNALLDRPAHQTVNRPEGFENTKVDFAKISVDFLLKKSTTLRPALQAKRHAVHKSEKDLDFANWNFLPDMQLGFKYRFRDPALPDGGTNFVSGSIGFKIPLYFFSKQLPERRAAVHSLMSAQSQLTEEQRKTEELVYRHYADATENQNLLELYEKQLVPQARRTLKSSELGYKVNKVDFLTLLSNETALFMHKTAYEDAKVSFEIAVAALEADVGLLASQWKTEDGRKDEESSNKTKK